MKEILTGVLMMLILFCNAQNHPKFSVQMAVGPSFPAGKFADKSLHSDTTSNPGGWAKPGLAVQLAIRYRVNKTSGITVQGGWQENHQDGSTLKESLITTYPTYHHYQVDAKTWKSGKILAGGYLIFPLPGNKIQIEPEVLAGVLKTSVPGYSYAAYNDSIRLGEPFPQNGSFSGRTLAWAFCYQAGANVNWKFNSKVFFLASLDFFHAAPSWSYTTYPFYPSADAAVHRKNEYAIEGVNLLVGTGYRF